jgi:uncharacterized protein
MPMPVFAPFEELAAQLLAAVDSTSDGSHDVLHLGRVWHNAQAIQDGEGGDLKILAASVLLHDCIAVEKNSPLRAQASRLSAQRARQILRERGWSESEIQSVVDAIESHSFSAGLTPRTLEARILQDADRLDAIGMVGIARCFYTAGRMGSLLYEPSDPRGQNRALDDHRYALDHFPRKLLTLTAGFQTETGRGLAQERHRQLQTFYEAAMRELGA